MNHSPNGILDFSDRTSISTRRTSSNGQPICHAFCIWRGTGAFAQATDVMSSKTVKLSFLIGQLFNGNAIVTLA